LRKTGPLVADWNTKFTKPLRSQVIPPEQSHENKVTNQTVRRLALGTALQS
jgi:hypothetical protein